MHPRRVRRWTQRNTRMTASRPRTHGRPARAARARSSAPPRRWRCVRDGDTLATSGFVGIGFAENLAVALEQRFLATGAPRGLTLVYAAGQGDGKTRGLNHLGHEGLVARVIGGHWGLVPDAAEAGGRQQDRGLEPAAGRDLAPVPRHRRRQARPPDRASAWAPSSTRATAAASINARTTEDLVRLMSIDGEEYLFYKAFPIDVALIRGTTADDRRQPDDGARGADARVAGHRDGGAQLAAASSSSRSSALAEAHALHPRQVKIPGILVDCVVVAEKPEYHQQTFAEPYNPAYAGEIRVPAGQRRADAAGRAQDHRPPRRAGAAARTRWSTSASACPRAWPRWPPRSV